MKDTNDIEQARDAVNDFFVPDEKRIRLLQTILQEESGRTISLEDAEEVGLQLIGLFECLARDKKILPVEPKP